MSALRPDLHAHSTASDGVLSPAALAARAYANGVTLLSLTDHDTLSGLQEARAEAERLGMGFLPGVEISAGGDAEVHILGYGAREDMPALTKLLRDMREERRERAKNILKKLAALGMPMPEDELSLDEKAANGRPHIARMLVSHGYCRDTQEAFQKYIGNGCPAYVPRYKLAVSGVVRLLRACGCVPVLAHPGLLRLSGDSPLPLIEQWIDDGLMGVEVYHPEHMPNNFTVWRQFADARGLLVTGGSDFHDTEEWHADIGGLVPYWPDPEPCAQALLAAVEHAEASR